MHYIFLIEDFKITGSGFLKGEEEQFGKITNNELHQIEVFFKYVVDDNIETIHTAKETFTTLLIFLLIGKTRFLNLRMILFVTERL